MNTIRSLLAALAYGLLASAPVAAAPAGGTSPASGGTILGMDPATAVAAGIGVAAGGLLVYEVADDDDEQATGGEPPVTPPPTTTTTTPSTVTTTTTTSTGG